MGLEGDHSKAEEFLSLLSQSSRDLAEIVQDIRESMRLHGLYAESRSNPFAVDEKGNRKFHMPTPGKYRQDMLHGISTLPELAEKVAKLDVDFNPALLDARTLGFIPDQYHGPKLTLFKDTNIILDKEVDYQLTYRLKEPYLHQDILSVIQDESQPGGLKRKFNGRIPARLARGQESLEKRCIGMRPELRQELTLIYDIFHRRFEEEVDEIEKYAKSSELKKAWDIAIRFCSQKRRFYSHEYAKTVAKVIEKCRQGERDNFVADRVLTAASFGFNLIQKYDRAIAVSNDRDLINMFDFFYQEVLPEYMAMTTIEAMKKRNPAYLLIPGCKSRTIKAAREQIKWAKDTFTHDPLAVGILYVPRENRFYVKTVASPLKQYFHNVEMYRVGKSDVISRMVINGKNAEQTVRELMHEEEAMMLENESPAKN